MPIERAIVAASIVVSATTAVPSKCYLMSALRELGKLSYYPKLPVLLIPDVLLMLVLGMSLFWGLNQAKRHCFHFVKVATIILSVLLMLLIAVINSIGVAYYQASGAIFQWTVAFDFLQDFKATSEFTGSNSGPAVFWIWLHVFYFVVMLVFYHSRIPDGGYISLLTGNNKQKEDAGDNKMWVIGVMVTVYFIWATITGPKTGNWISLAEPQLVVFTKAAYNAILTPNPMNQALLADLDSGEYEHCETISSAFEVFSKAKPACQKQKAPDFSFTRREAKHQIKNVIWVYLESTRNDILPLNKESRWVKENVDAKVIEENTVSPFFSSLVEKGLYFENFRTISTYTVKSILGGLCSVLPLPLNKLQEWDREPYRKCLPRALSENGWETLFMQPASSKWEHQCDNMLKVGFRRAVGYHELKSGVMVGNSRSRFRITNYFGCDDIPMIQPVVEWMQNNGKAGKASFATLVTNISHDPYRTPKDWPVHQLAKGPSQKVNSYLNAARYTDEFIEKLVSTLDKSHLLEETLLVVSGDHGASFGEHKRIGTNENPNEETIRVPLLIYSKNKEWLAKNRPRRFKSTHSSIDIVPTILDFLNEDPKTPSSLFTDYYEGSSLVRDRKKPDLYLSVINPGGHSLVFHQDGKKVIAKSETDATFFNLRNDPGEDEPIEKAELKGSDKVWFETVMEFRPILLKKIISFWN